MSGAASTAVLDAFAVPLDSGGLESVAEAAREAMVVLIGEQSHGTQVRHCKLRVYRIHLLNN
jgi:hypothetical protein